ncbi:unnamed protein product [Vicia faba]|uniref:Uncharacterized protein n=1 Tax=Vicia faba TaxID=3906 RepID=A0AAV0Z6T6_VICFA|nr:unnamed protein product [Vicia faba]
MENNSSDNIDNVVNDSVNVGDCFIHMNNEVHDGSAPINEGVLKDVGFSKRFNKKSKKKVENRKDVLKAKRAHSKKIPTPTKAKKTPKKMKKYVIVSEKSSRKKRNVTHRRRMDI